MKAVLTITVERGRTSLHTVADSGLKPDFILDAAQDALNHERDSLSRCPFHTCDSDGSGEAGETAQTGSAEGDSAGRQASPNLNPDTSHDQ